jgi:hypothetical protein
MSDQSSRPTKGLQVTDDYVNWLSTGKTPREGKFILKDMAKTLALVLSEHFGNRVIVTITPEEYPGLITKGG